jgi:hypothetical protein
MSSSAASKNHLYHVHPQLCFLQINQQRCHPRGVLRAHAGHARERDGNSSFRSIELDERFCDFNFCKSSGYNITALHGIVVFSINVDEKESMARGERPERWWCAARRRRNAPSTFFSSSILHMSRTQGAYSSMTEEILPIPQARGYARSAQCSF